jgi:hypothetical protein
MRRRLKYAVMVPALLAVMLTGCSEVDTDPPSDVTNDAATLKGTVSCNKGTSWWDTESGHWYFRWRPTFGPVVVGPWVNGPVREFNCYLFMQYYGMTGSSTGPVSVTHRVTGLPSIQPTSKYRYIYQLCGDVTSPDLERAGNDLPESCLSADGTWHPASEEPRPPFYGATEFDGFGATYNPATDAGQSWAGGTDGEATLPREYGAGTGWDCGTAGMARVIEGAGLRIARSTLRQSLCWGTGHNRGRFKNYAGQTFYGQDISVFGTAVGWKADGAWSGVGPQVQNGKLLVTRVLKYHVCFPMDPIFGSCISTTATYYHHLKIWVWVNSNNQGRIATEGRLE